eukprot:TRINITY_DN1488_c0_g2_i2.p1 TRINITY_DN1488_c0_g2~~TRINITY_DN1488_c0_g2_i2.p1  ORF type:complete len:395 (-),score=98.71 TRINITY_DN1488_c0_g2_i2:434-1618(-)
MNDEQESEIEALKAIFLEDFLLEPAAKKDKEYSFKLRLVPHPGDQSRNYCAVLLHISFSRYYPSLPPRINVEKVKGLSDAQLQELTNQLKERSQELVGTGMIFSLCDLTQEYLMSHNIEPLSFHEEMLLRQKLQLENKEKEKEKEKAKEEETVKEKVEVICVEEENKLQTERKRERNKRKMERERRKKEEEELKLKHLREKESKIERRQSTASKQKVEIEEPLETKPPKAKENEVKLRDSSSVSIAEENESEQRKKEILFSMLLNFFLLHSEKDSTTGKNGENLKNKTETQLIPSNGDVSVGSVVPLNKAKKKKNKKNKGKDAAESDREQVNQAPKLNATLPEATESSPQLKQLEMIIKNLLSYNYPDESGSSEADTHKRYSPCSCLSEVTQSY